MFSAQAAGRAEDHFCQTWSLLIAIQLSAVKPPAAEKQRVFRSMQKVAADKSFVFRPDGSGLAQILRFLRLALSIDDIAEGAYYEIYRRTHTIDGQRHYGARCDH
jgi:hypothetical protein